jgi:cell division protease FtsH
VAALAAASPDAARAADFMPPQESNTIVAEKAGQQSMTFGGASSQQAPAVRDDPNGLPEGNQWRYSEFIQAVQNGKVERVRFSKDGSMLQVRKRAAGGGRRAGLQSICACVCPVGGNPPLTPPPLSTPLLPPQLTAVDGRRATVVLPNDPDLVDILAKNGVDISVSEGDQQGNYVSLLGNILFPLIAFGGLFFLFRRAQGGQGGGPMGPMGGPMEFGRSKSKFQEVPETGVTFADVAVSGRSEAARESASAAAALLATKSTPPCPHSPLVPPSPTTTPPPTPGLRRRQAGAGGGRRLPEEPRQVHRPGRQDPQGLPACGVAVGGRAGGL